ncbi:flagellar motor protein MotB [Polaromonas sp. AET17H-212]|uniref:flagellar motor protein MotB n=1 Tax=Polaromonas sp. AET17H-212 TaxID=1977061 RepID=UPI000BBC6407|nr:flagellar motor protein MotB [Polaromonas sp. AET17H-212]
MAEEERRPIIIKRIKKKRAGHHGGAWKIAYADFVTAMMAFFLLMWLIGSTDKGTLRGIEEYFKTPLKVALAGGSGSGERSSVIPGGGKDPSEKDGQLRKEPLEQSETARLKALKSRIETAIETQPLLTPFKKQLLIDITTEGLRIQIVDEKNRPMFALSKAELQPYTRSILHELGSMLNDVPNKISLSGHTDATPYASGEKGYSNWELSADRAGASRRALVAGGMDETKVLRVVGLSSAVLLDTQDPVNPINRRISIILMTHKAEEAALNEGKKVTLLKEEPEARPGPAGAPTK